jgi:glycosyltransferase involved in cell wall biosynthesis
MSAPTVGRDLRVLLVGVRAHGGEEVYSRLLRDHAPAGVRTSATFDFHRSCPGAHCHAVAEVALNQLLHPWLEFDLGFRVLRVEPEVDLVHVHSHPTILRGWRGRPVVFSAGSSHYHYVRDYERWPEDRIRSRYARARAVYRRLGVHDALLHHDDITLAYTFSRSARLVYLDFGIPRDKIRVLYPGFDVPEMRPREADGTVRYLFMGRQPRRKGGDTVLAAFARLRESLPAARLRYVTDEPPAAPIPGVETSPLVPLADVPALYAASDVFVNPTRAEGFGFTNAEAQGFGLPVISTRRGAIPEVVEHGRTGLLLDDPDDGDALLQAMRRLGENAPLRREMGEAARAHFASRFSLPVFQAGLRAIYDEARARAGA